MNGTFKWYNTDKGYGFINGEDSKDYFVHHTSLPEDQGNIRESDEIKVTFDVVDTQRGVQAQNVVFANNEE